MNKTLVLFSYNLMRSDEERGEFKDTAGGSSITQHSDVVGRRLM